MAAKAIGEKETVITVKYPEELGKLEAISKQAKLPFSPRMVRILLPYGPCHYLGKEGDTEPPHKSDAPGECYLAYGSSITHGGMALMTPWTYPFQIACKFEMISSGGVLDR